MKNYKELIKKYKNDELTIQERKEFEAEIESSSELLDFILDKEQFDFSESSPHISEDTNLNELTLKRKIHKRIIKLAALITISVLCIITILYYSVPKLIDLVFYNPLQGQELVKDTHKIRIPSDYELEEYISNQLNLDEDPLTGLFIEKTGTAKYSISKEYYNDFRGEKYLDKTVLDKSIIQSTITDSMNRYSLIYGESSENGVDIPVTELSDLTKKINTLPDSSYLNITATFSQEQNWNDIISFIESHPNIKVYSTTLSYKQSSQNLGIRFIQEKNLNTTLTTFEFDQNFKDTLTKTYPGLFDTPTIHSSETDVFNFIHSTISYLNDHVTKSNKNPILTMNRNEKLATIKKNELTFSKITLAIPKSEWNTIISENQFNSIALTDLSLFSN